MCLFRLLFLIGIQPQADIQCLIDPPLVLRGDLPGPLPQAVFVQRADLLQQHHAVLGKACVLCPDIDVGGQAGFVQPRMPPCSEPTTGERSA